MAPPQRLPERAVAEPTAPERAASLLASEHAPSEHACARLLAELAPDTTLYGDVAARCDRPDDARRAYEAAWSAGARDCALALVLADQSFPVDLARERLRAVPACRAASLRLAELALDGATDEGLAIVAALLRRDADDADAIALLVRLHAARAEHGAGLSVCERAPGLAHLALWRACADLALEAGRLHAAEDALRAALALDPTPSTLATLGELLLRERRHEEAFALFGAALSRGDTPYDVVTGAGRALDRLGCLDAADALLDAAMRRAPERPEAYWYRATSPINLVPCFDMERSRRVLSWIERFLELAGDDPRFADAVEQATRRCARSPARRSAQADPLCEPGIVERLTRHCGGTDRALAWRSLPARASSFDCHRGDVAAALQLAAP
ncbi:MAG: hypothetical protein KF729_38410 [Sandaracinaceae bacterium]|nr:hypothetical protein [Sandaracinaceae bacterium]